ncbi:hypothetical protein WJR50_19470 [Catalinimonas sp. 4WD22]|uniref:hypothetical protein n=1 Tax=Catalinimonas locisalis TaxID=3133978 RepID=UPI00310125AF
MKALDVCQALRGLFLGSEATKILQICPVSSTFTTMRRFLSLGLIWIVVLNAMSLSVVQLSFELNRDYIAEFLCIEREKEISVCRGICFLKDKLKKAEDQQEQNQMSHGIFAVFYTSSYWENIFLTPEAPSIIFSTFQENLHATSVTELFFHPPRA